ncbi:hypothetical protein [Cohnella sp.]|uniref:hypothetical protein n=1 Tax=Cohnella sp. TaxID=1883426 RepID=UPI00356B51D1
MLNSSESTEGGTFPLTIAGEMTVKGLTKEVIFTGQGAFEQGVLSLKRARSLRSMISV